MSISASQVKELREMSGVGMMECKKALVETDGDLEKALDLLRANSSLKAEKKASRVAADGEVKAASHADHTSLVEINSETDFAAKDEQFKDFTNSVAEYLANNNCLLYKSDAADDTLRFDLCECGVRNNNNVVVNAQSCKLDQRHWTDMHDDLDRPDV